MSLIEISRTDELHTEAIEAMRVGDKMFIDWSTPFFIDRVDHDQFDVYLAFGLMNPLTDIGEFLEAMPIATVPNAESAHEVIGEYLLK